MLEDAFILFLCTINYFNLDIKKGVGVAVYLGEDGDVVVAGVWVEHVALGLAAAFSQGEVAVLVFHVGGSHLPVWVHDLDLLETPGKEILREVAPLPGIAASGLGLVLLVAVARWYTLK